MTSKRILIISDDRDLVSAFAQWCQPFNVEILMTADGRNIAKTVLAARPDLICVDLEIETDDCSSICDSLSSDAFASRIPEIVLFDEEISCTPSKDLCAYYLRKRQDLGHRITPVIEELIDVNTHVPGGC